MIPAGFLELATIKLGVWDWISRRTDIVCPIMHDIGEGHEESAYECCRVVNTSGNAINAVLLSLPLPDFALEYLAGLD